MYRKNVAGQFLYFALVNATTGAALTGASVTGKRGIDGAAQASVTGTITEDAGGQYHLALSQADTNGNNIGLLFTATNAIPVSISIVTTAADPTDATAFGLSRIDAAISSRSTYAGGAVASVTAGVTVAANNDKTGYALTAGEHTAIAGDAQTGLTAQGYTSTRAGFLDTLNGLVQAIWDKATSALTTAGSIGKWILDKLDVVLSTRLATSGYTAPDTAATIADTTLARALPAESYATNGSIPTFGQMLYMIWSAVANFSITGTTITTLKLDRATTAMTFGTDSATSPTSRTRSA